MNLRRLFFSVILLAGCSISVIAQQTVSGVVTDSASAQPLAGATIRATGTNAATATASNGSFSIKVPAGVETITVSSIGFKTQEVRIGSTPINIALVGTAGSLNEVVVVAYGTRRKGDLTGAITSLTAKDFQKGNITSSDQLLVGKVAGLQVTSGGGSPGGGSKIRIRGGASLNASNDPLIVIDGVPVDNNGLAGSSNFLNTIDPNDIESVSVLKDASATALYGSRASNGVIIVTTKKGQAGNVKFNFNTQASLSNVPKTVPVLSAAQVKKIITQYADSTGDNNYVDLLGNANTNWQDLIYQNAFGTDNNLSASGSVAHIPFRISGGYNNQEGILKTDKFSRVSTAINLSPKFFDDHLAVNLNVKYSHTHNNFANQGAIGAAVSFDPTQSPYATNKYGGYFEWLQANGNVIGTNGSAADPNPLGLLNINDDISNVDRMIGNIQLDYKFHFLPDLHLLVNLGLDRAWGQGHHYIDSTSSIAKYKGGIFTDYQQGKSNVLSDVSLLYNKELNKDVKFDVLVLHSYQDFFSNVYNVPNYNQSGQVDSTTIPTYKTDKPEYRLESYLGRINFTLANKYLLTASLRRDGSSKFSPSTRVGYFPAGALAWKLKDEFFKNSNVLSDLKLRLGLGVTGQQDGIAYYSYLPVYYQSTSTAQYEFGSNYYYFLRPTAYDPNIKWETTTTSNIGLDFGFWKNRISGSIDFYEKKTKDLLSVVPIAPGANFDITLLTNVGNMTNKGAEFTLNLIPVQTKNVTWNLNFNISYNKSKITNLLKNPDPSFTGIDVSNIAGGTGNTIGKFAVGYAPYSFLVYKQVYDQKTGKPIEGLYADLNRDGQITDADRYYYKKPAPDVLSGISTQVTYKQWSLGLAGHASFGNYLYNNFYSNSGVFRALQNPLHYIQNVSVDYLNTNFSNNQYLSDYYIENASFFRLDNINIGYNAGKVFHDAASLSITANIQNVFVITKYRGLDPEVSNDQGIDNNIYPRPRIYSIGLNLNF
ncbi:MAG: SusC/RagA family TonB-linked outer membrane protein [Parafilimonas sp.]